MKRKLIIFLTLLALSVCMLVMSVSASTWLPDDSFFVTADVTSGLNLTYITNDYNPNNEDFKSTLEETVGIVYHSSLDSLAGYINIEWWHEYFSSKNVNDKQSMIDAVFDGEDLGYWTSDFSFGFWFDDELSVALYNSYIAYVNKLNESGYEAGQASGYAEGFRVGSEGFLNSKECQDLLEAKEKEGALRGVANYKASEEHASELRGEYDKGFNAGQNKEPANIVGVVSFIATLCTIAGFVLILFRNKKTRRK